MEYKEFEYWLYVEAYIEREKLISYDFKLKKFEEYINSIFMGAEMILQRNFGAGLKGDIVKRVYKIKKKDSPLTEEEADSLKSILDDKKEHLKILTEVFRH